MFYHIRCNYFINLVPISNQMRIQWLCKGLNFILNQKSIQTTTRLTNRDIGSRLTRLHMSNAQKSYFYSNISYFISGGSVKNYSSRIVFLHPCHCMLDKWFRKHIFINDIIIKFYASMPKIISLPLHL